MPRPDWDSRYAEGGELPWDVGTPDDHLVSLIGSGAVKPCRAIEVGCGTGTNALWLGQQGFDVVGVDLSPRAIERARAKAGDPAPCRFEALDFLHAAPPDGPYGFAFDRGCLHVFDDPADRARFASRIAALLAPGGLWLSLIGSTEGGPRDSGPPRRTARDVVDALEPSLEIRELRAVEFTTTNSESPAAWYCLARRRRVPASPSTVGPPGAPRPS